MDLIESGLVMVKKLTKKYLIDGLKQGDKRCASHLMSLVEDGSPIGEECLGALNITNESTYVMGVTGWPGVGKSTLVYRIARSFLAQDKQVGIIAIDPSSPFTGGSLLGDRERMKGIDGDERLFIRSAATRGHTGGIASSTRGFIKVMEAMGKEVVILETVGVGQDQVSVTQMADTIILILIPGMGDYIQSLKAGVLETGDIFVVNKSDREGVNQTIADLKMIISLTGYHSKWTPPILKTIAINGSGIDELVDQINRHRQYLKEHKLNIKKRQSVAKAEVLEIIKSRCLQYVAERIELEDRLDRYARQICDGSSDPYAAADGILTEIGMI